MKLYAPKDTECVSVGGVEIKVIKGAVDVSPEIANELKAHGFITEQQKNELDPAKS